MHRTLITTTLIFLLFGCNTNNKRNLIAEQGLVVNLGNAEILPLSSLYKKAEIVKLETLPHTLLGDVSKIIMHHNHLFLLTEGKNNGVFKFDRNGKFIKKILAQGDAPGEYGFIENFDIVDNSIYLLDNEKLAIHEVDTSGQYKKTIKTGGFALDMIKFKNQIILYSGNSLNSEESKKITVLNNEGEVEDAFFSVNEKQARFLNINPKWVFSKGDESFSFLEPFGYAIISFKNSEWFEQKIVFEEYKNPEEFLSGDYEHIGEFLQEVRKDNIPILFSDYINSNEAIMFSLEYDGIGQRKDIIIDKNNNKVNIVKEYKDDMVFMSQNLSVVDFKLGGYNATANQFIYYMNAPEIEEMLSEEMREELDINFADNPYIIILTK